MDWWILNQQTMGLIFLKQHPLYRVNSLRWTYSQQKMDSRTASLAPPRWKSLSPSCQSARWKRLTLKSFLLIWEIEKKKQSVQLWDKAERRTIRQTLLPRHLKCREGTDTRKVERKKRMGTHPPGCVTGLSPTNMTLFLCDSCRSSSLVYDTIYRFYVWMMVLLKLHSLINSRSYLTLFVLVWR